MTVPQQIERSTDAALVDDLANYQRALAENRMPEMHWLWQQTITLIEAQISKRQQAHLTEQTWFADLIDQAPF